MGTLCGWIAKKTTKNAGKSNEMDAATLYERDFYSWTQEQASAIRNGEQWRMDIDNILEEIEAMGRAEKRALRSKMSILLTHLIKWQYQPERRGASWRATIAHQRNAIEDLLRDSPGLKPMVADTLSYAWASALRAAEAETGLDRKTFPKACPWGFAQMLDEGFWPSNS